ncbi:thioesterase II family protein [Streptomyces vinaceus]|uniref:thioesterase II family protein n=1 Tax=Streptomyces vinaceus TaxID=1960 RepID=UPI00368C2CFD
MNPLNAIVRHRPVTAPALRLVCFPHAGGTAGFFRGWSRHLAPDVELLAVQYPGRETRFTEPLVPRMAELADSLAGPLAALDPVPTVFLGHSMGAAVAHETLLRLEAAGSGDVRRLCVSGRAADRPARPVPLTDEEIVEAVGALGGTSAEVWEDPDLREMLLPIVRNDYHLIDAYRCDPAAPPLRAGILALTGDADPRVTPGQARAWESRTSGPFGCRVLPGDHFYLVPHAAEVARLATAPFGLSARPGGPSAP